MYYIPPPCPLPPCPLFPLPPPAALFPPSPSCCQGVSGSSSGSLLVPTSAELLPHDKYMTHWAMCSLMVTNTLCFVLALDQTSSLVLAVVPKHCTHASAVRSITEAAMLCRLLSEGIEAQHAFVFLQANEFLPVVLFIVQPAPQCCPSASRCCIA